TLEQAYYISQMVAAVFLILSVIYLALQVRQNTSAMRLNNFQAVSVSWANVLGELPNNEEVTDIYRRGLFEQDTLNEIEQIRFRSLGMLILRMFHECFEEQHEGGVRQARWESSQRASLDIMQTPGMQILWSLRKHWFPDDFQVYMDNLVERSATEAKPLPIK
ncbi:MAG: hypothetical protein KAI77_04805, partial [Gammaproteobacteria bacterium]|nr:hypothetical protein [Gammaproteobacteria bacterium]